MFRYFAVTVFVASLALSGCNSTKDTATPVPESKGDLTPVPQPSSVPLAATGDGSATNTANLAHGEQPESGKK